MTLIFKLWAVACPKRVVRQGGVTGLFLILALASSTSLAVLYVIETNTPYIYMKSYREGKDRSVVSAQVCRDYVVEMFKQNIEYDITLHALGDIDSVGFESKDFEPRDAGFFNVDFECRLVSMDNTQGVGVSSASFVNRKREVTFVVEGLDLLTNVFTSIETELYIDVDQGVTGFSSVEKFI